MKAQAIKARNIDLNTARKPATRRSGGLPTLAPGLPAQARGPGLLAMLVTRVAIALLPALAIVALAALTIANPATAVCLQAALWTGGFLYLALAVDSDKSGGAALNFGLGVAVQALAWLSVQVAPELAVAAAALVAVRVAAVIFRRGRATPTQGLRGQLALSDRGLPDGQRPAGFFSDLNGPIP